MTKTSRTIILAVSVLILFACSTAPREPVDDHTKQRQGDTLMKQGHGFTETLAWNTAYEAYNSALNIYALLDDRSGMILALLALGRISLAVSNEIEADESYAHARALAVSLNDARLMQRVINHQADHALRQDNPVAAITLLTDSDKPLVTDGRVRASQLRLLGTARYALGDEMLALNLLAEAGDIAETANEKVEAAQCYYKMASILSLATRFDEAKMWALRALDNDKAAEYGPGVAADLRALSLITRKAGDVATAEDYARRSWLAWRGLGLNEEAEKDLVILEELKEHAR